VDGDEITPALTWEIDLCRETELPDWKHWRTTDTLTSVTGRDALPDFTGNMRYRTKLTLPESERLVLELGKVGETAEVTLNGKSAGVRLTSPYRFDLTELAHPGENELEILVTNTCTFEQRDSFSKFLLIPPSGLLGPVKLIKK